MKFDFDSLHTEDHTTSHSDHHPLTIEAIVLLLRVSQLSSDPLERNSIHCRLVQGIRGITCPHPIDNDIEERMIKVNDLYIEEGQNEATTFLVACKLYELMENNHAQ